MDENFKEFCGGEFWNETLLLDNSWPQFTDCFQQTIISWVPCAFLWLLLPRYVISVKRERTSHRFGLTLLNACRLALCILLALLHLTQLLQRSLDEAGVPQDTAAYLANALWTATFLLMAVMSQYERINGVQGLGIPFFFWLLTSLCSIIPFYHLLKQQDDVQDLMFITGIVIFSLQLLSLFLTFFVDSVSSSTYTQPEKPPCPETRCSFPSFLTFFWVTRLILTGFKRDLREDDLWQLSRPERSDTLVPTFFKLWEKEVDRCKSRSSSGGWLENALKGASSKNTGSKEVLTESTPLFLPPDNKKQQKKGKRPSLLKVIVKMFWWEIIVCLLFKIVSDVIFLLSPFFLNLLLNFLIANEPDRKWQGYVIALGLFLTTSVKAIFFGHSLFGATRVGIRIKSVLVAAIYKKVLTMNNATRNSTTAGKIVNMMSVDVQQIMERMDGIFFGLTTPVQIIVAVVMLYQVVDWAVFVGIGVLVFQVPLNAMLARMQKGYREKNLHFKDGRVKLFGEILNAVKVIKLYAWEQSFRNKIWDIRKKELDVMLKMVNVNAIMGLVWDMAPFLVTLTTFVAFVVSDRTNQMTAADAFVSLAYFNILRSPLNTFATMIVTTIQSFVSVERINQFLVGEDLDDDCVSHDSASEHVISITNGTFAWTRDTKPCLTNINLHVGKGKLIAVVGPVGCGKSSLINAMLGEMEKMRGTVSTRGSIAYVPQQAWIQNATVRDNVQFGKPYIRTKYTSVIKHCQLERDLELLPAGDMTEIGEKGINLSGGQKQRVSLARAMYSENDVYLLDDPLSAVDSHVGKALFKNVIGPEGLLKDKTRILVTHGVHWLPMVDEIIVMQDGKISERGSYEALLSHNGPFAQFLKTFLTEVAEESTDDGDNDPQVREILERIREKVENVTSDGASSGEELYDVRRRRRRSTLRSDVDDRQHSRKMSRRELDESTAISIVPNKDAEIAGSVIGKLTTVEALETGKVKREVFGVYGRAAGMLAMFTAFFSFCIFQAFSVAANFWLNNWTGDPNLLNASMTSDLEGLKKGNDFYLTIYGVLGIFQALFLLVFNYFYWTRMAEAARTLHANFADRVLRAPMAFFDTTPIGRILNRASRDVETVDNNLPMIVRDFVVTFAIVLLTLVVVMIQTPMSGVILLPVLVLYYFVQGFYVPSARQLKRLEAVTRSPIYTLFSETLNGAASIRAYSVSSKFMEECKRRVDHNQVFFFAFQAAVRWLQWNLDILAGIVVFASAVFSIIAIDKDAGDAGLSVSYALQVSGTLTWMTRQICEFETNIVSVERLKEYSELEKEAEWVLPDKRPPPSWPEKAEVIFENYRTRYRPGLELVLKGVNCSIKHGEKVGIVGRTGAGKSSLTLALFRLIEAAGGAIWIDNVNIADMGLHDLRQKLTILPQDPVLFSGTLRMNLDPFDEYDDDQLWTALERAHLKNAVTQMNGDLQYEVGEEGANLSVGQRQLVCLARTLLRPTKILVLDEATAAVDMETDVLIQNTIRSAFSTCTVITIAHRLNTIMDYDRIMVMDAGVVQEFSKPGDLLADKTSLFYGMAKDAGLV